MPKTKLIRPPDTTDVTFFLRMLFTRTERELIAEITRKRASGYVDYAEVAALERVQHILQNMVDESWDYVPTMIEKIFYKSDKDAAGYKNARTLTSTQIAAVQQLSNNLLGEIEEAAGVAENTIRQYYTIARLENDPYRTLALKQVLRQEAAGKSWVKTSSDLIQDMQTRGITAFVDRAGRHWSLQSYGNMAVRTTARQAEIAAVLTADDHDLYQIVKIGSTCPVCAPLEGRVYSKSGTDPDYPPLSLAFGKIDPLGGDDLSNTYLNIHPSCLHSLIRYTTIGKTEKQIQRDKEFSDPQKNPISRDPRTKKQIAAYREKEKNRRKLLEDKRQYKEYRAVLGKEASKDFDDFRKMKYNEGEKWESKKREFATVSKISAKKSYTEEYRRKMLKTYYSFKDKGYEFTDHSLNRYLGQKSGKGKKIFSETDLLKVLDSPVNYVEDGGRTVKFYNGISVIQNGRTKEVVSIVTRTRAKEGWKKYE